MSIRTVNHIASVAIIFNAQRPDQIFAEIKDDGLPVRAFRRGLCPPGGNWIGDAAVADAWPRATLRREIQEELSFEKPAQSTLELSLLGIQPKNSFYRVPSLAIKPTKDDIARLGEIKQAIIEDCTPFGDYVIIIPKDVFIRADPQTKLGDMSFVVSYWLVALNRHDWPKLFALQRKFGNLSNESITVVTSLEEIIETGVKCVWGHDRPLQQFFLAMGYPSARKLPLIDGIKAELIGPPLPTYEDYLARYNVLRKPEPKTAT